MDSRDTTGTRRERQPLPRAVWSLVAARAVNRLGAFSLSYLTVLISTRFGASPAVAGGITAAFGLATIPSRLAGGRLADRIGRRRTVLLGLTGCAVAQLGIAAADGLSAVAVCALLLGLCYEVYEPPSQALIADVTGADQRVRAYGLLNLALAAAGLAAGLLATGLGRYGLRWLFVADAASCLLCAAVVRLALPADRPPRAESPNAPGDSGHGSGDGGGSPWRDRALLAMLATGTLFALVYLQLMLTLPLALARRGLRPNDAGLLMAASALTLMAGQPLLRRARPTRGALAAGYLLLALGLAGYALAHTLPACLGATVMWSLGDLLLLGRAHAAVAELAPPGGTGRYLAAYGISWGIAGVAAPVLGTQLLQHLGPAALWTAMAGACLLLAGVQPMVLRPRVDQGAESGTLGLSA